MIIMSVLPIPAILRAVSAAILHSPAMTKISVPMIHVYRPQENAFLLTPAMTETPVPTMPVILRQEIAPILITMPRARMEIYAHSMILVSKEPVSADPRLIAMIRMHVPQTPVIP
jgi:hypothetical protein